MKALLLGAENEIGAAFLKAAAARSVECVPVEGRKVDLGSARRIGRLLRRHRPDIVLNAVDYLPDEQADHARLQHIVRDGAHNIAKAAHARETPLIQLSTDALFYGAGGGARTEQDAPSPVDAYGRAHLEAETRILQDIPRSLILRSGWIFSAHPEGRLVRLLHLLESGSPLALELDAQFAPTAADDLARVLVAIVLQVSCGIEPWGIYHYCAADIVSWRQFLQIIATSELAGGLPDPLPCVVDCNGDLPAFPVRARVQLNCQKLLHHFGIRQRPWSESLQQVLRELAVARGELVTGADRPALQAMTPNNQI